MLNNNVCAGHKMKMLKVCEVHNNVPYAAVLCISNTKCITRKNHLAFDISLKSQIQLKASNKLNERKI